MNRSGSSRSTGLALVGIGAAMFVPSMLVVMFAPRGGATAFLAVPLGIGFLLMIVGLPFLFPVKWAISKDQAIEAPEIVAVLCFLLANTAGRALTYGTQYWPYLVAVQFALVTWLVIRFLQNREPKSSAELKEEESE